MMRTSSMLHALAVLATSSIQCERKALFAILHATKKHNLEIPLVTKVSKTSHWYTDYCFPYKFYIYNRFKFVMILFFFPSDCADNTRSIKSHLNVPSTEFAIELLTTFSGVRAGL